MGRGSMGRGWMSAVAGAHLRTFLTVAVALAAVWALTGFGAFWPAWVLVIWGFVVFRHVLFARRWERRAGERHARRAARRGYASAPPSEFI